MNPDPERAVVLVSGGMDSCVTAALARARHRDLAFLHASYGQRTATRERRAFEALADHYAVARRLVVAMEPLRAVGGSSLTDPSRPVSAMDLAARDIPSSYVPFRNGNLLAVAVSWAETLGASRIYIGAVGEDASGYPDCRPAFYAAFNAVIATGTAVGEALRVETPVIHLRKAEIVREGLRLGAPLHLTWSCYQGETLACGLCDSCGFRLRGFFEAGVEDPLPYADRETFRAQWAARRG
jgi:7-cyano-7-deazaguanine synthase